ncbi:Thioesterase/thiol ester dehydrase-isomerase [Linderina pennispora]|uniref:Thioesterase/thiol ester dehydrase-isomerase n=1 Tax=Linderina pennispora TaxID=61395 RepID=A0A1Y1WDP8_9FUNG|nr:Thioesterase/thiol ester dehydrase-isomerase [Linderina pennispora]ORX71458.1 Thioesterase/thiol ester dehydrase-isomerase [Linderina pennispora]
MSKILELEELDVNLYRSKYLRKPVHARGVFGGHVVGQALVSATKTVSPEYKVHSLHSHFLLAGDNTVPIIYEVQLLAKQHGRGIFTCTISFQRPEKSQLVHQYVMPDVPQPESIPSWGEVYSKAKDMQDLPDRFREYLALRYEEPLLIDVRRVSNMDPKDMVEPKALPPRQLMWMRATERLNGDPSIHHCVLAYCTDHEFLDTSVLPHAVSAYSPDRQLNMIVSLDHTIWFHADFRADDWLLYEMESPYAGGGRGLSFGRVYTRDGLLVASIAQEGVIRANISGPSDEKLFVSAPITEYTPAVIPDRRRAAKL